MKQDQKRKYSNNCGETAKAVHLIGDFANVHDTFNYISQTPLVSSQETDHDLEN